jgi:hypothetical protein
VNAGASLFTLFSGRPYVAAELETVRILGIALLASKFLFVLFGQRIERTIKIVMGVFLIFVLTGLVLVTLIVVPPDYFVCLLWQSSK